MNSHPPRDAWSRLTTAARNARDDRDASVPYGFSTRIAALAFTQERTGGSVFDRFALRALGVASLLALGSLAANYNALMMPSGVGAAVVWDDSEVTAPTDDAVALVFDVAD